MGKKCKGVDYMLHFFTDPYKDELIYSAIARYHYYAGNIDFKDTLEECFGKRTIIPSLEFGSPVQVLARNLGGKYTTDYIINKHTILPYYIPFLPRDRDEEIIKDIKHSDCGGIYTKIGMVAGGVCKKDGIYYCAVCARNELETFGEAFIHREHQLQGISMCANHGVTLNKYIKDKKQSSRLEFIKLEDEFLNLKEGDMNIENYEIKLKLAKDSYWLLNQELRGFHKQKVLEIYRELLWERGLTTSRGTIRQKELYEEVISFYGRELLRTLESDIDNNDEYNWLRVITRDLSRSVHPIRHLLLINFLVKDISIFFNKSTGRYNPFGEGPWPCLNKAASHYHQDIVVDLNITEDFKSRLPVGTFTCSCGFSYSRKGPDKSYEDRYRIGRIKYFGQVWEHTLKGYLNERKYGLRELSRLMHCGPKTIIRYDEIFKTNIFSKQVISNRGKGDLNADEQTLEKAKVSLLAVIDQNPKASRTEIRALCKKEYILIYRKNKTWLYGNLPQLKGKANHSKKADWEERDKEVLKLIQDCYMGLKQLEQPVRITKSIIGKRIGRLAELEKTLNKLPDTEAYLKEICETVEEFQLRRCKKIVEKHLEAELSIKIWEIQRLAGIRKEQFENIKSEVLKHIAELDRSGDG